MFTSKPGKVAYFDVDDTLIEWYTCDPKDPNAVKVTNNGHIFYKRAVKPNIESLKDHAYAGHIVVVWSQGGAEWAAAAIKALELEEYVDVVLTKPDWFYDDKEASHWLPERQFRT